MAKLKRRISDYQRKLSKTNEEAMTEVSKACAKQLAYWTEPVTLEQSKVERFQKNIIVQISRALMQGYSKGVSGGVKELHRAARDRHGRVPPRKLGKYQRSVIDDEGSIYKYQRETIDKASMAKSSWIAAADKLKGGKVSGVGRWANKLRKTNIGKAAVRVDLNKASIFLTSDLGYASHRLTKVQKALQAGYKNAFRRLGFLMRTKTKATI